MRRYPPPRYTKDMTNSTSASVILMIITVCCPPLGLIAYLIYAFIGDNNISLGKIAFVFVLIGSPVVTILSLLAFGVKETLRDSLLLVIISVIELVCVIIWLLSYIKSSNQKKVPNNSTETTVDSANSECSDNTPSKNHDDKIMAETTFDESNIHSKNLIVYITNNAKKYHKNTCVCISNRTDLISISIEEATKRNIPPCKICLKNLTKTKNEKA